MLSELVITPSPHISKGLTTRRIMLDVIIALVPAMIAAAVFFRHLAVIITVVCVTSCVVTEWLCNVLRGRQNPLESVFDFSAVITGLILAFSLPPAIPWWAAIIGSVFAIAVGKMVFGGLGANIFNPAMIGRAFLMVCFGMMMTTWTVPATIDPNMPQIKASSEINVDARTQATPLALNKQAIKSGQGADIVDKQLKDLFFGNVGGCIGETSALALIIGGIYLLIRRTITVHIPLSILLTTLIISEIAYQVKPLSNITPWAHLCSGGLLIGAFFIATDPVTSPITIKGQWIFGIGVGALTMLIRLVGGYPEGVMFSVLMMNALSPLIDRFTRLIPIGGKPNVQG